MSFKRPGLWMAVAVLTFGGTVMAQDGVSPKTDSQIIPVVGLLAKANATTADCDTDHKWLHPVLADAKNKVRLGFGVRPSFRAWEDGAVSNGGRTRNFNLDNVRIFLSADISDRISANFHTDINNAQGHGTDSDELHVLDAFIDYKLTDNIGVKFGRFLPPTDRSNLSGPFFLNAWEFPWVQYSTGYYDIFQGRDDGMAIYGNMSDGSLKWAAGVFEGHELAGTGADTLWWVGRVVKNFLDNEEGYFNSSTYYGEKEVAAIGLTISNQQNAFAGGADYFVWSFDALYEKPLDGGGVITLETAYYDRDDSDGNAGDPARQGSGYFVLGSYLLADSMSLGSLEGRLQPAVRYQEADRDTPGTTRESQVDFMINYIIHGHSARLAIVLSEVRYSGGAEDEMRLTIGGQIRF